MTMMITILMIRMMMTMLMIRMTMMMTMVQPEPAQICRAMRCCEEVRPGEINIIMMIMKL